TATPQLTIIRHAIRKGLRGMVSLLLPVAAGGGVVDGLASGRLPRAGGPRLDLGLRSSLAVANAASASVRAVGAEDQEGGEDGEEQPCARREGAGYAEREGDHAARPVSIMVAGRRPRSLT